MTARSTIASVLTMLTLSGWTLSAQAPTLQQVKDLYAQAAYEEALGALTALPRAEPATEAGRYRAACLVALGRAEEARQVVDAVVGEHPEYQPDPSDTSPRVVELFQAARAELLPAITKRLYGEARAAMDRKDAPAAIKDLEDLLQLLESPELRSDDATSDLKMLASGFLELTRAQAESAPAPVASAADAAAKEAPVEAPTAAPVITPATPISQQLPPWVPPSGSSRQTDYAGWVRVQIGVDGKVVSATIVEPVHPAYNGPLLAAAREWLFEPARRDGVQVASERLVQVILKAR